MTAILILFICLTCLSMVLSIVKSIKQKKEMQRMTMSLFEERLNDYIKRKDGKGLFEFLKRNTAFIILHRKKIGELLKNVDLEK